MDWVAFACGLSLGSVTGLSVTAGAVVGFSEVAEGAEFGLTNMPARSLMILSMATLSPASDDWRNDRFVLVIDYIDKLTLIIVDNGSLWHYKNTAFFTGHHTYAHELTW